MQLKVNSEYSNGGLGKGDEYLIHAEHHNRAYRLHEYRGQTYSIYLADNSAGGFEALERNGYLMVFRYVEPDIQPHANELTNYGGVSRACNSHFGAAEQAENHYRVKNDVGEGARYLGIHTVYRYSRCLQQALADNADEYSDRPDGYDRGILDAHLHNGAFINKGGEKRSYAEKTEQRKSQRADNGEENSVYRDEIRLTKFLLAQSPCEQRVYADRSANADRYQWIT